MDTLLMYDNEVLNNAENVLNNELKKHYAFKSIEEIKTAESNQFIFKLVRFNLLESRRFKGYCFVVVRKNNSKECFFNRISILDPNQDLDIDNYIKEFKDYLIFLAESI